jgi:hypothetical protein
MHIGQPGSPVPVNGINIRSLSVIFVSWNIYSFNAMTTGVNARALRVPHTSFRVHYAQGCWQGGKCVSHRRNCFFGNFTLQLQLLKVSTLLLGSYLRGKWFSPPSIRVIPKQRPTLSQLHAT